MSEKEPTSDLPSDTPKSTGETETDSISFSFDGQKEGMTTFRGPLGLRQRIDDFLRRLAVETKCDWSRTDFILNAIRFYVKHLMQFNRIAEFEKALTEKIDIGEIPLESETTTEEKTNEV